MIRLVLSKRLPKANALRAANIGQQLSNYRDKKDWSAMVQRELLVQHPEWEKLSKNFEFPLYIQVTECFSEPRFRPYDADNTIALTGKLVIDALTARTKTKSGIGFIQDDSPGFVQWLPTSHFRYPAIKEFTVVSFLEYEEAALAFRAIYSGGWNNSVLAYLGAKKFIAASLLPLNTDGN